MIDIQPYTTFLNTDRACEIKAHIRSILGSDTLMLYTCMERPSQMLLYYSGVHLIDADRVDTRSTDLMSIYDAWGDVDDERLVVTAYEQYKPQMAIRGLGLISKPGNDLIKQYLGLLIHDETVPDDWYISSTGTTTGFTGGEYNFCTLTSEKNKCRSAGLFGIGRMKIPKSHSNTPTKSLIMKKTP